MAKPPNRWLGVAINDYPGAQLQGCVADRQTIMGDLTGRFNSVGWNWLSCINAKGTKARILDGLKQLGNGAISGQTLVASFSGHGTPQERQANPGVLQTVFCPVDFDWSEEHSLFAHEVLEVIGNYPSGINLLIIWDSCYSEWDGDDGFRNISPLVFRQPRRYPLFSQPDVVEEHKVAVTKIDPLIEAVRSGVIPCCYIPACLTKGLHSTDGETAADVRDGGNAYGAHTHYLSQVWNKMPLETALEEVVNQQRSLLDSLGYQQHSYAEGSQKGMTLKEMFGL